MPDTPSPIVTTGGAARGDLVAADCQDGVTGGLSSDWRDLSIIVGPVAFHNAKAMVSAPAEDFEPKEGRYLARDVVAVVEAGRSVRLVLPEDQRRDVALLYGEYLDRGDGRFFISDGNAFVELRACDDRDTQFRGGFVVTGPRCMTIDVLVGTERIRSRIPNGTRCS